jgi:phosphohistidine phosphatase
MDIFLVRHGEALSEEQDEQRPLSPEGSADVQRVAAYLAQLGSRLSEGPVQEIRHSGKARAQQTAETIASALGLSERLMVDDELRPRGDARALYKQLRNRREDGAALFVVGHLPHLRDLAGLMLNGDEDEFTFDLAPGGVLKLAYRDGWRLEWYITPACVP